MDYVGRRLVDHGAYLTRVVSPFFERPPFSLPGSMTNLPAPFHVTAVDSAELPDALREDWNRLAAGMPLRAWEWYALWWRTYREGKQRLRTLVIHDEQQRVRGIAPWYQTRSLTTGHVLRFLGDNEICTDYQTILTDPADIRPVATALAEWLLGRGRSEWDLLDWRGVTPREPALVALRDSLTARGATVSSRPLENSWRIELPASWETYLKEAVSKSRREKVKYFTRRYFQSGRAKLHCLSRLDELDRYLAILVELHQARRVSLGEPGCFANPKFLEFHRPVMGHYAVLGRLRLQYVTLDGTAAAAEYSLSGPGGTYYYQSGMNPCLAHDKPGWLCLFSSLRMAIERGEKFFDFLRGDEAYKASWGARPIPLEQCRIAAGRPVARFRQAVWLAGEQVRGWAKQRLRPAGLKSAGNDADAPETARSDKAVADVIAARA